VPPELELDLELPAPEPARPYMPTKAGTEDWCSPRSILDAVRPIFGGKIDLDPCSNPWSIVGAELEVWLPKWRDQHLATGRELPSRVVAGDGLEVPWVGNVYVNSPFDASTLGAFMDRARRAGEAEEASTILLSPSKTDIRAWHRSAPAAAAICFLEGRVDFIVPGASSAHGTSAPMPTALLLFTADRELVHRFAWYLDRKHGHVLFPR
jgi:hypothetical protein